MSPTGDTVSLAHGRLRARWAALARFLLHPAAYIREAQRGGCLGHVLPPAVWACARSRRALSPILVQRLGDELPLDIAARHWALALLDAPRLDNLARHIAAWLVSHQVRRALSREEVRTWREWLQPQAYAFAQTTAGLLPALADRHAPVDLREGAEAVGWGWMLCAAQAWPDPVLRRFALKAPVLQPPHPDVDAPRAARLVYGVLCVVEPQWVSSFPDLVH